MFGKRQHLGLGDRSCIASTKRTLSRKEFVGNNRKCVLVRTSILQFGIKLFGRHIRGSSITSLTMFCYRFRSFRMDLRRDTEIDEPRMCDLVLFAENDVFRFHVPMKDLCVVDHVQRICDFLEDREDLGERESVLMVWLCIEPLAERFTLSILHDEKNAVNRIRFDSDKRADILVI